MKRDPFQQSSVKFKNTVKTVKTVKTFYFTRFEKNLKEIDEFLDIYDLPKFNYDWINNLSRPITSNKIEVIRKSPTKPESPTSDESLHNSTKHQYD
jgi:hypothetical protein